MNSCLVFVEFFINELVLSLFLERDDDQRDEDVDEEERKHDEVDDVEDGHVHPVARLWTAILARRVYRVFQHATHASNTACLTSYDLLAEQKYTYYYAVVTCEITSF